MNTNFTKPILSIITFVVMLSMGLNAQLSNPCWNDSAGFGLNQFRIDNDTIPCYPYCTRHDSCEIIQLPDSVRGFVQIGTDVVDSFQVLLMSGCDTVLVDTCLQLGQSVGLVLSLEGTFGQNWQVVICGVPAEVFIRVEYDPALFGFYSPILLLDTLCPPVGIQEPKEDPTYLYFDMNGIQQMPPLKPGMYLRQVQGSVRREKIVVTTQ